MLTADAVMTNYYHAASPLSSNNRSSDVNTVNFNVEFSFCLLSWQIMSMDNLP